MIDSPTLALPIAHTLLCQINRPIVSMLASIPHKSNAQRVQRMSNAHFATASMALSSWPNNCLEIG